MMSKSRKVLFCVCTDGMSPFVFQRKALFDKYKPGSKLSRRKGFKTWDSLMEWVVEQQGGNEFLVDGMVCSMDVEQTEKGEQERGFVAMRYSVVRLTYEQKLFRTRSEAEGWLVSRGNLDEREEQRRRDKEAMEWSKWLPDFLVEGHGTDVKKLDASLPELDNVWTMGALETFLRQTSMIKTVLPGGMVLYLETERIGDRIYVASTGFSWTGISLFESVFFLVPDKKSAPDEIQREALAVACALEDVSLQQSGPLCVIMGKDNLCRYLFALPKDRGRRDVTGDYGEAIASLFGIVAASGKDVRLVCLEEKDEKALHTREILEGVLPEKKDVPFFERWKEFLLGLARKKSPGGSTAVRLDREAIARWSYPSTLCVRKERLLFAISMPGPLEAYTDASFHDGKAGCSATVYWKRKLAFRVDLAFSAGWLTSSKAELLAILNLVLHVRDGSGLKIYTDYIDVTYDREPENCNLDGDVTDYLALRGITQRLLSVAGIEIAWVKGHAGNDRNNDVDLQARNQRNELQ